MHVHNVLAAKGTEVAEIEPTATARDAARRMSEQNLGSLVVTRDGELVGIVSERDLARALAVHDDPVALSVGELMSTDVITCRPTDTVAGLLTTMTERRVRHLPVLDDEDRLCGLVSIGDLVKRRFAELRAEAEALKEYISVGR